MARVVSTLTVAVRPHFNHLMMVYRSVLISARSCDNIIGHMWGTY